MSTARGASRRRPVKEDGLGVVGPNFRVVGVSGENTTCSPQGQGMRARIISSFLTGDGQLDVAAGRRRFPVCFDSPWVR